MIDIQQIEGFLRIGKYGVFKASLLTYSTDTTNQLFRVLYAGQKIISRPITAYSDGSTLSELITFFDAQKAAAIAHDNNNSVVFGSQFQKATLVDERQTSSTDWVDLLTLQTSNLPSGQYSLKCYTEYNNNKTTRSIYLRFIIGSNPVAEIIKEAKDDTDYSPFSSFTTETLTGANVVKIQFKVERSNTTIKARRSRIELFRVS